MVSGRATVQGAGARAHMDVEGDGADMGEKEAEGKDRKEGPHVSGLEWGERVDCPEDGGVSRSAAEVVVVGGSENADGREQMLRM